MKLEVIYSLYSAVQRTLSAHAEVAQFGLQQGRDLRGSASGAQQRGLSRGSWSVPVFEPVLSIPARLICFASIHTAERQEQTMLINPVPSLLPMSPS